MRAMGTVAAPLLAGFGLATLALLATANTPIRFGDLAITLFTLGSVLFVFCLQFTAAALQFAASPGERLAWRSLTGDLDPDTVAAMYKVQHRDARLLRRYQVRARLTYDLGILGHLGGLLALVAPGRWWSWHSTAFTAVAVAFLLELWWIVGGWLGRPPRWLLPGYGSGHL
jgi:hypothetical protein